MALIVAPILEGKVDAWKQWIADLQGPRSNDLTDMNRRYGLTKHVAWLAETPSGAVVVAIHEGPGSDEFMPKLGPSQNEFDISFKQKLMEIHGMDVNQPPPGPMPELYLDSGA